MDAVGDLLANRREDRIPWGGATLLAFMLHGGVLAVLLISAIAKPMHYARPRFVAVRLLQAGSLRANEPVKPAAALPAATEKPKIEKPPPEEAPPPPSKKAVLLPAKEDKKKPTPPPSSRPGKSTGPAISLPSVGEESATASGPAPGAGGIVGIGGFKIDQTDFNYGYYIDQLTTVLSQKWAFPPTPPTTTHPVVHFQILKDGTITDARIVVPSGNSFVDRKALRAVLDSTLPPLPAEYGRSDIGIQVEFE